MFRGYLKFFSKRFSKKIQAVFVQRINMLRKVYAQNTSQQRHVII